MYTNVLLMYCIYNKYLPDNHHDGFMISYEKRKRKKLNVFQIAKIYSALISTQKIFSQKYEGIQADFSYLPEIDIKISTKPAF